MHLNPYPVEYWACCRLALKCLAFNSFPWQVGDMVSDSLVYSMSVQLSAHRPHEACKGLMCDPPRLLPSHCSSCCCSGVSRLPFPHLLLSAPTLESRAVQPTVLGEPVAWYSKNAEGLSGMAVQWLYGPHMVWERRRGCLHGWRSMGCGLGTSGLH